MTDNELDAIVARGRARVRLVELVEELLDIWDHEWLSVNRRKARVFAAIEQLRIVVRLAK